MSVPINKNIDDIRQEMYENIESVQDEYTAKGWLPIRLNLEKGIMRGLVEIWTWGLNQVYILLKAILDQIDIDNASGLWLELICRWVQIFRKKKTKAIGTILFSRTDTAGNCVIKQDRIVRTRADGKGNVYRFITTEEVVMAEGIGEINIPVVAEDYGQNSNVVASQIVELVTPVDGVDSVTNGSDWLVNEGNDDESDESLRERYKLEWKAADGCTKYAYEKWALSVTGVKSAQIEDQHPRGEGTVDIILLGSAGIPSQQLIDDVTTVTEDQNPINDDFLVKSPNEIAVDIVAEIEVTAGTTEIAIITGESVIADIFPLDIGEDLTLDRITSELMNVLHSKNINITTPVADTPADNQSMIILNSLTITAVLVEA
jgi:uncharacterized phage protein gp47/JayE